MPTIPAVWMPSDPPPASLNSISDRPSNHNTLVGYSTSNARSSSAGEVKISANAGAPPRLERV